MIPARLPPMLRRATPDLFIAGVGVVVAVKYPGDTGWARAGIGGAGFAQAGIGDANWSRAGVGGVGVAAKES